MSAPLLWIVLPLILAVVLWIVTNRRVTVLLACTLTSFLTFAAWLMPIDTALKVGGISVKIGSSLDILGRHLVLTSVDRPFLVLIYGSVFFWFLVSIALPVNRRLIPLGLMITSLLVASTAVDPFLYAALLIEMAVLLAIPLLAPPGQAPGKGLIRFLIFETLAMPFILFSGWLLAAIEANPGNVSLIAQVSILLGMGFAFLLSVFPFYTWIPLLAEEAPPYSVGFILWMFTTTILFFGLGFIDRYTWLQTLTSLPSVLKTAGLLMVVTGGILAAFQRHLGRMLGYAVIVQTGVSLLAIGLGGAASLNIFILLLIPRALAFLLWSAGLALLKEKAPGLKFEDAAGLLRQMPFATCGVVVANLSLAGLPLLTSFPVSQALWEGLARQSLSQAFWIFVGSLGLLIGALRTLSTLSTGQEGASWSVQETRMQRIFFASSWIVLTALGLFPQWALSVWTKLPAMFIHIGQ